MSIKKLFEKERTEKVVTSTDLQKLDSDIESGKNLEQRFSDINRYVPQVDFSNPENFARFGSAEKYYTDAIDRVVRSYPYDGSEAEINEFHNESNYIDKYIFDNLYPRTTGYVTFSPHDASDDNGGWGASDTSPVVANLYYGESTTKEYIEIRGGPHSASYGMPEGSLGYTFTGSNVFSTDIYNPVKASPLGRDGTRESNLRMNLDDGITVEFWLKKESFIASKTQREVIFDLWNQVTSSSPQYGRLRVELTASGYAEDGADPFRFTFISGAFSGDAGFSGVPLGGTTITTASVADNKWHHYAFSVVKGASTNTVRFYRDGELVNTVATGSTTGEVTGSLVGFIGALQTPPSRSATPADNMVGWGKLSGSVDEFRYWKVRRTSEQIRENFFTQVRGGSNTDISNADLGVYYKFNEGITTDTSLDSTVLDYSGRMSNGIWVGYSSDARSTGSAIVEYSGSNKTEYEDPIIYSTHPDVQSVRSNLASSASYHDLRNNTSLYHSLPSWVIDDDVEKGGELKNLTQIIGNYFDTLYLQIEALPDMHSPTYQTSSGKPLPFANRLLESKGFITSEIFANADIIEAIKNRDTDRDFSEDLHEIKNLIYKNIYNNLVYIYKTKGTEKSFRNLIRCFGVDEDVVKINLYADNATQLLRDNFRPKAVRKNFIDFQQADNQDAVVTHWISSPAATSADNPDAVGVTYISASHKDIATTAESEVIFPRLKQSGDLGFVELTFVS
ncbi:LamG domain-containing protein, partial [Flavobacteriales bacterium]|nr:LamG domain-containing protein [Flavobacteriales bacterium]